ncbi:conserved hypothetical protein [Leishmania major strain Friedlin]|uniref:Uncharacterized protein n=1 Tax=Leishmania major TaxID=5664 RepID=Q4Q6Z8_LEIMA|nr:conserved hypothetical protein [Leishmania major strain Friedlin]CAG9578531.1 hypothetical_protein_-_conserved [Leishmania major strain Friedlin]CAJ06671.1 conserved hypothetical protein [Leishmania major strain Friedlin]|eukprot:XP_001684900.1 conserved hypothetical protein [Leishmania major strain Friedlin]
MLQPCVPRLSAVLCVIAVLVLLGCVTTQAQENCGTTASCKPYDTNGPACARKKRMNLRFMLQTCRENNFTVDTQVHHLATYSFCPIVDQLSSFTLIGAPFMTSCYITKDETSGVVTDHLSMDTGPRYLSVYGFGASNSTLYPQKGVSTGTVLIAVNGADHTGVSNSVGIVTMLSLEIGLHNGLFNYDGAAAASETTVANPNYDPVLCNNGTIPPAGINYCDKNITIPVAATVVQPAKVGFTPTCSAEDVCTLGDPSVYTCIGEVPGQKNCGVYRTDPTEIRKLQMTVWVSYYGTDWRRNVLTSGGRNPLNYLTFVKENALQTLGSKIDSLFHGNLSDRTL